MNREQMVEKAAHAVITAYCEPEDGCPCQQDWDVASAVVDAILPQVTTVAELDALPVGAVLVTQTGDTYTKAPGVYFGCDDSGHVSWDAVETLYERVPDDEDHLTVVWQP